MTEQERLIIVDKINDDLKLVDLLEKQREKLKQLEENEKVKEYLEVLNQVSVLSGKTFNSEEQAVHHEFSIVLNEMLRKKEFSCCEHDIWMYYGTWGMRFNNNSCNPTFVELVNEWGENFSFNKYICLECGKEIRVSDWKEFEKENIVLKTENDSFDTCFEKYLKYKYLYYELLYKHPVQEANDLIVKEFYKGRRYPKKKIKK